ncbi:MAG TPA: hypothetical protein ENN41_08560, partial [Sediminispirochaeta sp.]|nr:hypothetical protein [Sediminispirochaeta sp.]
MKKRTPWKLIPLKSVPIFILLLLSLGGTQAFSFSPTVVLGGRLDQVFSPQSAALWGDMYGFGSWRTTLGSEAYAVFNADSSFSLPLDQQAASVDQHSLSAQVGLSLPRGSLLLSSETFFSIKDPLYGLTMLPDWRGRYGIALDQKSTKKAYVGYSGSYLYQEKGTEDRLSQSTAIGFI